MWALYRPHSMCVRRWRTEHIPHFRQHQRCSLCGIVFVIAFETKWTTTQMLSNGEHIDEKRKPEGERERDESTIISLHVYFTQLDSSVEFHLWNAFFAFKRQKGHQTATLVYLNWIVFECAIWIWLGVTRENYIEICVSKRVRIWLNQSKHLAALNFLSSTNLPYKCSIDDSIAFRWINMCVQCCLCCHCCRYTRQLHQRCELKIIYGCESMRQPTMNLL